MVVTSLLHEKVHLLCSHYATFADFLSIGRSLLFKKVVNAIDQLGLPSDKANRILRGLFVKPDSTFCLYHLCFCLSRYL